MIFHANEEQKGAGVVTLISVYFIDSEWMKKEKPDKYTCRWQYGMFYIFTLLGRFLVFHYLPESNFPITYKCSKKEFMLGLKSGFVSLRMVLINTRR